MRAYAQHFDLNRHIRLRSRLIQLRPKDDECEGWTVLFQDLTSLKVYKVRGKGWTVLFQDPASLKVY